MRDYYDETRNLLRSRLELWPAEDKTEELIEFFKLHGIIERAVDLNLCLHGVVMVPLYEDSPVVVEALWRDVDAYASWQEYAAVNRVAKFSHLLDPDRESVRHLSRIAHISRSSSAELTSS